MKENMGARDDGSPSWVIELEAQEKEWFKEKETDEWKKHSIYKLPEGFVRDKQRVQLYEPQVVSLGPYHHWKEQLQAMEEHKRRALYHLHTRTRKSVKEYWEALKEGEVLQKLMDAYKDLDPWWKDNKEEFLKMMILDGCFMLEVMRVVTENDFNDYAPNDPIFSRHGMKRDMLMLENQIPLLVLHKLAVVQAGLNHEQDKQKQWDLHEKVNNMVLDFFQQVQFDRRFMRRMRQRFLAAAAASTDDHELWGLHVLDVVRNSMIKDIEGGRRRPVGVLTGIWHATQLKLPNGLEDAGIRFKRSDSPSLKDITFRKGFHRATLSLPQLLVDDATESKFLNLMAFEHLHMCSKKEVSSYVSFMSKIIKSDKDVSLLSENNIIKNFVVTDQAVAVLFNGISHDVSIDPASYLSLVFLDVFHYCNYRFNKQRAHKHLVDLKRSYFKSPWTFISLMAGILLLSLTIIQSVYTILQYYNPN